MAEKEERISVIVYEKDPCKNCPGNPMTDCQVCEKDLRYDGGMTRKDAIGRMAKALHSRSTVISDMEKDWGKLDESWRDGFCKYAEAALNALLEEQNER